MGTVYRGAPPAVNAPPLRLESDPALPISAHRDEIIEALARHPAIVVCGATGSGKSTQLPKFCLRAGRGTAGLIGHTQPRRIAARALATRVAEELGTTVGAAVGYQVRFTDRSGPNCRVKLMTDGILLKELESDRDLRRYDTLIIDEAHERSLNIDLLLGVLRRLLPRRPELRLIVTSATIEPARIAEFFGGAPVIEVSGRSYPVEVRYRPLAADERRDASGRPGTDVSDAEELSLPEGIVAAVRELQRSGADADTLVFLPGEKHIREATEALARAQLRHTEVLPLYARLSSAEQARIFQRHALRRVILATNVAETSLTVPGIRHVIDSGLARISRYSPRAKVQRLHVEPISQASAEQRKGRCGREAAGICIRLYTEADFDAREPFTAPEVLRTNLASVMLRMATLELGEPQQFPFLDPPDARLINDGARLLEELQAMDAERRVTPLGRKIATIPLDPRLGRMLLAAARLACLAEMLVIAAFLETHDPRERPTDMQQQAEQKHALFADARSDFVTVLNLWRAYGDQSAQRSGNQLRRWCREHFLSFLRMREWQDLHSQLTRSARELGLRPNQIPAGYPELHQAILTGFLGSVGKLNERRDYDGPRGMRFVIAPGTPLAARPPKWVVAGSLLQTTRLYARMVAAVEPAWIERAATHLVKRSYSEPHWVERRGMVGAFETVTLYGLPLATRRRVDYGRIAPEEARDIFIHEALIEPEDGPPRTLVRGEFLDANRALSAEIRTLEAKIRRRDILADEQRQLAFYRARIPPTVSSVSSFARWWRQAQRSQPRLLHMARADALLREPQEIDAKRFPDAITVGGNSLPLRYRFEPGEPDDGATLLVPDVLLDALDADRLAWLVPGWRLEKITALLRELPKSQRKRLVPVPEHARQALAELAAQEAGIEALPGFYTALAPWIARRTASPVSAAQLAQLPLPPHLRLNVRVVDANDTVLAQGRDVAVLRRAVRARAPQGAVSGPAAQEQHRRWEFGELPETRTVHRNGLQLVVHPTLRDTGQAVIAAEARDPAAADAMLRGAVMRLALLALAQQARYWAKRVADEREVVLASGALNLARPIAELIVERIFADCFASAEEPPPRTRQAFEHRLQRGRAQLETDGERVVTVVRSVCTEWRALRSALGALRGTAPAAAADIDAQVVALLSPQFILTTPDPWFGHLPRYLKAAARRAARLPADARRDAQLSARVAPFTAAWHALLAAQTDETPRPQLERLRWMIEELRVSFYAQELRTAMTVSERRLSEQVERARAEAGTEPR